MNVTDTRQPTDGGQDSVAATATASASASASASVSDQQAATIPSPGLRERKKQQLRRDLSRTALRLAIERGPENVRIEDVTIAVGVSYRTFANYFGSREEAIVAVAVDQAAQIVDQFRARPLAEPLAEALIQAFTHHPYRDADSNAPGPAADVPDLDSDLDPNPNPNPNAAWLPRVREVLAAPALVGAYLAARLNSEKALAEAIAERTRTDAARDLYPRVLAAAVLGAEHAAVTFWLDTGSVGTVTELIRQAIDQVVVQAAAARDVAG